MFGLAFPIIIKEMKGRKKSCILSLLFFIMHCLYLIGDSFLFFYWA